MEDTEFSEFTLSVAGKINFLKPKVKDVRVYFQCLCEDVRSVWLRRSEKRSIKAHKYQCACKRKFRLYYCYEKYHCLSFKVVSSFQPSQMQLYDNDVKLSGELFKYKFDVKTTNRGEYQMSDKEFSDNCPPLLTYCTTASDDASSDEDEFVDTGGSRIVKPVGVARELGDGKKEFTITSDGLKPTSSGLHVVLNPVGISVTPLNLSSGASNASETDQSSGNSSRVGSAAPSHKGSPECSGVMTEDENGHGSDKGYEAESETSRKVSSDKLVFGSVPLVKSKLSEVSVAEKISSEDEFGCDVSGFFGSGGDGNLPPSANDDVGVVVQAFQRMQPHGLLNEGLVGESTGLGGVVIMLSDADVGNVDEAVEGLVGESTDFGGDVIQPSAAIVGIVDEIVESLQPDGLLNEGLVEENTDLGSHSVGSVGGGESAVNSGDSMTVYLGSYSNVVSDVSETSVLNAGHSLLSYSSVDDDTGFSSEADTGGLAAQGSYNLSVGWYSLEDEVAIAALEAAYVPGSFLASLGYVRDMGVAAVGDMDDAAVGDVDADAVGDVDADAVGDVDDAAGNVDESEAVGEH
ncbi:hypothetical protein OROGR_026513 [Orobanche gracilis]